MAKAPPHSIGVSPCTDPYCQPYRGVPGALITAPHTDRGLHHFEGSLWESLPYCQGVRNSTIGIYSKIISPLGPCDGARWGWGGGGHAPPGPQASCQEASQRQGPGSCLAEGRSLIRRPGQDRGREGDGGGGRDTRRAPGRQGRSAGTGAGGPLPAPLSVRPSAGPSPLCPLSSPTPPSHLALHP